MSYFSACLLFSDGGLHVCAKVWREVELLGEGASSAVENYTHDYAWRL